MLISVNQCCSENKDFLQSKLADYIQLNFAHKNYHNIFILFLILNLHIGIVWRSLEWARLFPIVLFPPLVRGGGPENFLGPSGVFGVPKLSVVGPGWGQWFGIAFGGVCFVGLGLADKLVILLLLLFTTMVEVEVGGS